MRAAEQPNAKANMCNTVTFHSERAKIRKYYKNKNHQLMHKKYVILIRRKPPTCFDPA
jgi:hypothetical protein